MRDRVLHVEKFARGNWNFREVEREARHAVTIPSKLFIHAFYVLFSPPPSRQTRVLQATARDCLFEYYKQVRISSYYHFEICKFTQFAETMILKTKHASLIGFN